MNKIEENNYSIKKIPEGKYMICNLNLLLSFNSELEIAYTLKEEFNAINKHCTSETIEAALDKFIEGLIIFNSLILKNLSQ